MTLLTRWEPFREFSAMQDRMNRMNRLFRESYSPEVPEEDLTTTSFAPPVDIYEDEHNITLKLEVPGIDEKDIDVRIENNTLPVVQNLGSVLFLFFPMIREFHRAPVGDVTIFSFTEYPVEHSGGAEQSDMATMQRCKRAALDVIQLG